MRRARRRNRVEEWNDHDRQTPTELFPANWDWLNLVNKSSLRLLRNCQTLPDPNKQITVNKRKRISITKQKILADPNKLIDPVDLTKQNLLQSASTTDYIWSKTTDYSWPNKQIIVDLKYRLRLTQTTDYCWSKIQITVDPNYRLLGPKLKLQLLQNTVMSSAPFPTSIWTPRTDPKLRIWHS